MEWIEWAVGGVFAVLYVGIGVGLLVDKYRYIRDCPVPVWSTPRKECQKCRHADDCGRAGWPYRKPWFISGL